MSDIAVRDLQDDLPFGARVAGVTMNTLASRDVRTLLNAIFLDRGMIVFEDIEPSGEMQLQLSRVFGPLVEHAIKQRPNTNENTPPGLIDLNSTPTAPTSSERGLRQMKIGLCIMLQPHTMGGPKRPPNVQARLSSVHSEIA